MRIPLAALLMVALPVIAAEPVALHCARAADDYPDAARRPLARSEIARHAADEQCSDHRRKRRQGFQ